MADSEPPGDTSLRCRAEKEEVRHTFNRRIVLLNEMTLDELNRQTGLSDTY